MKREFDHHDFAKALKQHQFEIEYRGKKRISTREIAKKAGINHVAVARAMLGKSMTIDNIIPLCDWMQIKIEEFIN